MTHPNLTQAMAERDRGMAVSLEHAEAVHRNWGDEAYDLLAYWCSGDSGIQFTSYSFLRFADTQSLRAPPTPKAWGSIFVKAAKNGLIRKVGYRPHPLRHASPTVLWEVV